MQTIFMASPAGSAATVAQATGCWHLDELSEDEFGRVKATSEEAMARRNARRAAREGDLSPETA